MNSGRVINSVSQTQSLDILHINETPLVKSTITSKDRYNGKYKISTPKERSDTNYAIHYGSHIGLDGVTRNVSDVYIFAQGPKGYLYLTKNESKSLDLESN